MQTTTIRRWSSLLVVVLAGLLANNAFAEDRDKIAKALRDGDDEARAEALTQVERMSVEAQEDLVDPLAHVVSSDPDAEEGQLQARACAVLGNVAQAHPKALDRAAIDALFLRTFPTNVSSESVSRECELALQKLGEAAVPVLLEAFEMTHSGVNESLGRYRPPESRFPGPAGRLQAVTILNNLRAEQAIGAYVDAARHEVGAPPGMNGPARSTYAFQQMEAVRIMLVGLGDIGESRARSQLIEVMKGEAPNANVVLDPVARLVLRTSAASALNRLGDRRALDAMVEVAKNGHVPRLYDVIPSSDGDQSLHHKNLNWNVARSYANLADGSRLREYKSLVSKMGHDKAGERFRSFVPMIELAEKCGKKEAAKGRARCYGEALSSENELVREKAAYELSRLPPEAAVPFVAKHLATDHLDTREVLIFAAYRVPSESYISVIEKILEHAKDNRGANVESDRHRLRMLLAWLRNNTGGDGS